jgi:hypothetical protein
MGETKSVYVFLFLNRMIAYSALLATITEFHPTVLFLVTRVNPLAKASPITYNLSIILAYLSIRTSILPLFQHYFL